jgi:2-methylisocitrate lyase-like PEP mutase family enzyme
LAARRFDSLFVSGFGYAASNYGLPDVGFIAWSDLVTFVHRLRLTLPDHHLLVDIDDGFGDANIATHVTRAMERAGASGIVLEDQRRPRRCGHLGGKEVVPLGEYLAKLEAVLAARKDLYVVARTDATQPDEIFRRIRSFEAAGCDAVLVDGMDDLDLLEQVAASVQCPVAGNVIAGGCTPDATQADLGRLGLSLLIYSTPCLFAAQGAIEAQLEAIGQTDKPIAEMLAVGADLHRCNSLLNEMSRR